MLCGLAYVVLRTANFYTLLTPRAFHLNLEWWSFICQRTHISFHYTLPKCVRYKFLHKKRWNVVSSESFYTVWVTLWDGRHQVVQGVTMMTNARLHSRENVIECFHTLMNYTGRVDDPETLYYIRKNMRLVEFHVHRFLALLLATLCYKELVFEFQGIVVISEYICTCNVLSFTLQESVY